VRLVPSRNGFPPPRSAAIVFLAVPESAVAGIASRLSGLEMQSEVSVVHVSGTLGLDALEPLRGRHSVGSFHPLQSFPAPRAPEAFRGITVAVDASTPALRRQLEALARRIGARPKRVDDSARALYHAAAVFASNYVVAVVKEAIVVLRAGGWGEAEAAAAVMPLVEGVVANLRARGPIRALTGPIRRGDAATVTRHLDALARVRGEPKPDAVYRMLGAVALEIAMEAGLDPAAAERTRRALTGTTAATRRRRQA
jgi:predicted short-subunit dehydrogenase-like oxidoreductase (DUF2520 family)